MSFGENYNVAKSFDNDRDKKQKTIRNDYRKDLHLTLYEFWLDDYNEDK